jgi:Spy/CpxP family protein refolding chaperone
MPVDVRLHGLSPHEIVQRLTPEELAEGLSEEQAARLKELLERRQGM